MTGNLTEEDFLHVFDEMSRICGDAATSNQDVCLNGIDDFRLTSVVDDDFLNNRNEFRESGSSSPSSRAPLVGDQLLSSTSAKITKRSLSIDQSRNNSKEDVPPRKRSRNSSANSGGSVDSAIGDIYFANTPHSDLERELLELTSASCEAAAAALCSAGNKQAGNNSNVNVGSLIIEENKCKYDEARERQAKEDEDLQFVFQDLPPAPNHHQHRQVQVQQSTPLAPKCTEIVFEPISMVQPAHIASLSIPISIDGATNWQQEIELVCKDLLMGYRHASSIHPPQRVSLLSQSGEDPLKVTTRLLADSLVRMKIFLSGLDSVRWLMIADQNVLYNAHVCSLAILKASVGVKLELVPLAFPLPYGENLSEVEALHLILAHDLFNELRSLLAVIKNLDIPDFSVMLVVMMLTFFTPNGSLLQPHKVMRAHDYYLHKLQVYLLLKYGSSAMPSVLSTIMTTVGRVRNFSDRLREFMSDVTRCGLQKQFESVCENIGLIAFLLHSEPTLDS